MTVIDSYLDTLFAPYPDSPRLRSARTELHAMMEDKLTDLRREGLTEAQAVGQVIAEFGTLDEVAPVLGIEREVAGEAAAPADPLPSLGLERAQEYVHAVRSLQPMVAVSVALFVLCVVPLLLLIAITGTIAPEPTTWAVGVGVVLMLALVAVGVVLLILRGSRLEEFEDVTTGGFVPTAETRRFAEGLQRENRPRASRALAVAIVLWILCAAPTVTAALAGGSDSVVPLYGVCLTLGMVALGLAIMLRHAWSSDATATLLQAEEEPAPETSTSPAIRMIAAVYWPLATAVFLTWGFLGNAWDRSWVIWPIAGVLYGALWAVNSALSTSAESKEAGARR